MGKRNRDESEEDDDYNPDGAIEVSDDDDEDVVIKEDEQEDDDDDFKIPKKKSKTSEKTETKKKAPAKKKTSKKDSDSPKEKKETKKKTTKSDSKTKGGSKGGVKKDVIKSEPEARKVILEYLRNANRPYSIQNMIDNLHGTVKKAMCTKACDKLVEQGEVSYKEAGKASKLYWINQEKMEVMDANELKEMNQQIRDVQSQLSDIKSEIVALNNEKGKINKALSNEELKQKIKELTEELEKKKARLANLREGSNLATPEQKKQAQANLDRYLKSWKERKRQALEIIGQFLEMTGKNKTEFYEECDIETDEQHGVNINEMGVL